MSRAVKEPLLSIRNLDVDHRMPGAGGRRLPAVRGASLDIAAGEILALVGESGSGKTSLASTILGLHADARGEVRFRGLPLLGGKLPARTGRRREIQAVFQDPQASLSPRRTVLQTLLEPLDHFRIGPREDRREAATRALASVGLAPDLLQRFPHELSGGQRQRVAVARAMAPNPRLIVADEPLSSLDVPVRAHMLELFRELRAQRGVAILFISHDLSAMRRLADTVAVMYLGRIVERGPARRVLERPAHPYTQSLLGAVPAADPARPKPRALPGEPPSPLTPPPGCVFHTRCEHANERCTSITPVDREADSPDHQVQCHLWDS